MGEKHADFLEARDMELQPALIEPTEPEEFLVLSTVLSAQLSIPYWCDEGTSLVRTSHSSYLPAINLFSFTHHVIIADPLSSLSFFLLMKGNFKSLIIY